MGLEAGAVGGYENSRGPGEGLLVARRVYMGKNRGTALASQKEPEPLVPRPSGEPGI